MRNEAVTLPDAPLAAAPRCPQETAINIAVSCALVKNPDDVMVLNVDDKSQSELRRLGCANLAGGRVAAWGMFMHLSAVFMPLLPGSCCGTLATLAYLHSLAPAAHPPLPVQLPGRTQTPCWTSSCARWRACTRRRRASRCGRGGPAGVVPQLGKACALPAQQAPSARSSAVAASPALPTRHICPHAPVSKCSCSRRQRRRPWLRW